MSGTRDLDAFGTEFTREARDTSVRMLEVLVEGRQGSEEDHRIANLLQKMSSGEREFTIHLVRRFIDTSLHNVLWMIERSDRFDLVARSDDGMETRSLKEQSDGLSAEPYTEEGWFARYSAYGDAVVE
jgi:hypothetical protein